MVPLICVNLLVGPQVPRVTESPTTDVTLKDSLPSVGPHVGLHGCYQIEGFTAYLEIRSSQYTHKNKNYNFKQNIIYISFIYSILFFKSLSKKNIFLFKFCLSNMKTLVWGLPHTCMASLHHWGESWHVSSCHTYWQTSSRKSRRKMAARSCDASHVFSWCWGHGMPCHKPYNRMASLLSNTKDLTLFWWFINRCLT